MAKWGEGDPRWIVEERPDAKNVNNWHWTEKNASPWSKERLKELLIGLTIDDDDVGKCTIDEFGKIEGEATANNRKCKLIFFYEWDITLNWSGYVSDCDQKYEGKIEIPNLSEENSPEDVDITVTVKSSDDNAFRLKELLRQKGSNIIRHHLAQYISELKEEFSQGLILPSKNNVRAATTSKSINNSSDQSKKIKQKVTEPAESSKADSCGKFHTKSLELKESFKCTAEDLFRVFTIKEMVSAFTRGACILEPEEGGKFSLFNDNISGEFVELVPYNKIILKWRSKNWPNGHHSVVTLEMHQKDECTDIVMKQTGIPENDVERTQQGWENYYWQSIKQTFGFGARLLR